MRKDILRRICEMLGKKEKYNYCVKICNFYTNHISEDMESYYFKGFSYVNLEDPENAIPALEKTLEYEMTEYQKILVLTQLAVSYMNIENYEKSIEYCNKRLDIENDEYLKMTLKLKICSLACLDKIDEANECINYTLKKFGHDEDLIELKKDINEED